MNLLLLNSFVAVSVAFANAQSVKLTLSASLLSNGKAAVISGTSDLPDGTVLDYDIEAKSLPGASPLAVTSTSSVEGQVIVKGGRYSRTVDITKLPPPGIAPLLEFWVAFQPASGHSANSSLLSRYGKNGEKLAGANVYQSGKGPGAFRRAEVKQQLKRPG